MTEQGQRMLKGTVRRSRQLSAESIDKDFCLAFRLAQQQCVESFMKWFSMAGVAASRPYITKYNAKRQMQWRKARCHWTL
ncbi:unnamed protein product, partial [Staurois parvus]